MRNKILTKTLLGLTAFVLSSSLHSAEQKNLAGIYSSLSYNEDSGDLGGMELLLVPDNGAGERYAVVVQISEGQLPEIFLSHIQVKNKTFDLRFKISAATEPQQMNCKFEGAGITCKNSDGYTEKMKHGKSYWQGA